MDVDQMLSKYNQLKEQKLKLSVQIDTERKEIEELTRQLQDMGYATLKEAVEACNTLAKQIEQDEAEVSQLLASLEDNN